VERGRRRFNTTPEWTSLIAATTDTLVARAQPDATKADPAWFPPRPVTAVEISFTA
jgi:hypothetical protein